MMQTALPASDVSDGGWTPTPVYAKLRKAAPDDSTFDSSSSNPQGDYFEVKLDPLAWPQTGQGAGSETLRVRLRQTGGGAVLPVSVVLVQGDAVIAARNYQPTAAFAEYDMVLTGAEVAAITNYADLRVRVYAGGPVTSCCPGVTLPATLYAHVTNAGALNGSYPLVWNGLQWATTAFCQNVTLICTAGTWGITVNAPGDLQVLNPSSASCSPLQIVFGPVNTASCGGAAGSTITILTS